MRARRPAVVFACLILAATSGARAFDWAVAPDAPGPTLPPIGRSLFDHLTMVEEAGRKVQRVPFPFEALVARVGAELGGRLPRRILVPQGRSLQRNAANPDFFRYPRVVVAVDVEARPMAGQPGRHLNDRLYLGYQERASTLEVISYNEAAGRFEFQIVRDYRDGGAAEVVYAERETCIACHQNHAPIFSRPLWDETNANRDVAAALAAHGEQFYGVAAKGGVDLANAVDEATDRANWIPVIQAIWRQGCEVEGDPDASIACRTAGLRAALRFRLAGNQHPATGLDLLEADFAAALERNWPSRWPAGLGIPDPDIPNRQLPPRLLEANGSLGRDEINRLIEPADAIEPFTPRPPQAVWSPPLAPTAVRAVIRAMAGTFAESDIVRLDQTLRRHEAAATRHQARCRIEVTRSGDELRFACGTASDERFALEGFVVVADDGTAAGAIRRLELQGAGALAHLVLTATQLDGDSSGGRLAATVHERSAGLRARLPTGDAVGALLLSWQGSPGPDNRTGTATIEVVRDFDRLAGAIGRLAARTRAGDDDALAAAPLRRVTVLRALDEALAADPLDWCCLATDHMPPATAE